MKTGDNVVMKSRNTGKFIDTGILQLNSIRHPNGGITMIDWQSGEDAFFIVEPQVPGEEYPVYVDPFKFLNK